MGGFIASLLGYGILQIEHPLHPWQWLFIVRDLTEIRVNILKFLDFRCCHKSLGCRYILLPPRQHQ